MKRNYKKLWAMMCSAAMLAGSIWMAPMSARAQDSEYTIKIANSNAPFTNINGQEVVDAVNAGCLAFKNYVEQVSGGRIQVDIYDSGVLGGSAEGLSQCMQNVVQACVTGDGELSTLYPKLQVLSTPYLFDNRIEFYDMLDSQWMESLFGAMREELGIRLLASSDNGGFRSISNNVKEVRTASDLAGLKIRCMEIPAYTIMLESMGATATPIAWSELYTSLQTGVVDGQENAPGTIMNGSLQEVQKYYTLDQHSISSLVLMMNEDFYQTLPQDLKQIVSDAGLIARDAMRGANNTNEALALQGLEEKGMKIYVPTPEEKLTFKDASQGPVLDWLKKQLGAEYVDSFMSAVSAVRAGDKTAAVAAAPDIVSPGQASVSRVTVVSVIVAVFAVLVAAFTIYRTRKKESD